MIELIEKLWRYSGDCNVLGIGYEGVDVAKGVALKLCACVLRAQYRTIAPCHTIDDSRRAQQE